MDVLKVREAAQRTVDRARQGQGPSFWCARPIALQGIT